MFKLGFLFAYISYILCESQAQSQDNTRTVCLLEDPSDQFNPTVQSKLDRIEKQQAAMEETLSAWRKDFHSRLDRLESVLSKIEKKQSSIPMSSIPPKFELIGSRYFYIDDDIKQDWTSAESTCRQMGGHLASFQNKRELNAMKDKLQIGNSYWLGINDQDKEGHFVSVASGRPAAFLTWIHGATTDRDASMNCVLVWNVHVLVGMSDHDCNYLSNFICQADSEV